MFVWKTNLRGCHSNPMASGDQIDHPTASELSRLDAMEPYDAQISHVLQKARPPSEGTGVCRWMAGGEQLDSVSRQGPTKFKRGL
jgi:hypothetical protein